MLVPGLEVVVRRLRNSKSAGNMSMAEQIFLEKIKKE
jgi:hypothetical protein